MGSYKYCAILSKSIGLYSIVVKVYYIILDNH